MKTYRPETRQVAAENRIAGICDALAAQRQEHADAYAGLIVAAADNEDLDPGEVSAALIAAGQTDEDLAADIKRCLRRRQLVIDMADAAAAQEEHASLLLQVAEADRELEAYLKVNQGRLRTLGHQIQECERRMRASQQAARELQASVDPRAKERADQVQREVSALAQARHQLIHDIEQAERFIAGHRESPMRQSEAAIGRLEERLTRLRPELERVDSQLADLEAEQAQLAEQALQAA